MMIFAFSFAANRAPEWSSGLSAMARSYAALTRIGMSSVLAYSRPLNWIMVWVSRLLKDGINARIPRFSQLFFAKFDGAVFCIDVDGLAFADFAFEDFDAKWVENFSLNGAPKWARAINWVVTFAREQFLG